MNHRPEQVIPVNQLWFADEYNPNEQDDVVFNALVETIEETGMTENIVVVDHHDDPEWPHPDYPYEVVSGNHRGRAAQVLGWSTIPARVWHYTEWDRDYVKFQNIRHNVLRGKISPVKFTKLFNELSSKYGEQAVKDMMKFVDQEMLSKVLIQSTKGLPKELREKVAKAKNDIKTVDDLSNLLNTLFSNYGNTLAYDFMVFDYGGKKHYWIRMDDEMKRRMDDVRAQLVSERVSMNTLFKELVKRHAMNLIPELPKVDNPDLGELPKIEDIYDPDSSDN